MSSAGPSIDQIKHAMRATWMAGDFGEVAKNTERAAEAFVARLNLPQGARALDIACGSGNLAIPLARGGADVTGVDIATNLLEQARARAAVESLTARFDEGDAEALPYEDGSFDVVVSMFGAMFAPRPELVVSQMARVLRPGGRLAMANWNPASFTGEMFLTSARHVPPPPGLAPPTLWGDEKTVRERLSPRFTNIETKLTPVEFDLPFSPSGAVAFFRKYFGPTQVAFSRLDQAGQEALERDLLELWSKGNIAADPQEHTVIRNEYLTVTATRA
jgi:SAM-dependent methyltransferase